MLSIKQQAELRTMVAEIREWSLSNFGHNHSKWRMEETLGSSGPLLGMFEEVGEFYLAAQLFEADNMEDSIADYLIFSTDFYCRGFGLETAAAALWKGIRDLDITVPKYGPSILMGRMSHVALKSHQGIRGYTDPAKTLLDFAPVWTELLTTLMHGLAERTVFKNPSQHAFALMTTTWTKVRSRNWKKDAEKGGESLPA